MTRLESLIDAILAKSDIRFGDVKKPNRKTINLDFSGYYSETDLSRFDGKIGVYCAYACNAAGELSDLVYIGRSGDNIKSRVEAHQNKDDEARSTLKAGEHLAYSFAETKEHELCETVLIARHRDFPRLANSQLRKPYEGEPVLLNLTGAVHQLHTTIAYGGPIK